MDTPEIFISYIHEDEIAASGLRTFLEAKLRVQVFVAGDQLRLGDEWLSKIRAALRSAKVVLALFSPAAINRPWVNFEAGAAWFSDEKILIPICIGNLSPENLPKPYSNIQGASLDRDLSSAVWYMIQDLWKVLELTGTSPPPFNIEDRDLSLLSMSIYEWRVKNRESGHY